jgi:hypothetical protein
MVTQPITRIEDINGDGCLDIGIDLTGYRDNQNWYVQKQDRRDLHRHVHGHAAGRAAGNTTDSAPITIQP